MNNANARARLRMTTSELAMGRFMKAPDHSAVDPEFEAFAAAGEVEVGDENLASQKEEKPAKKPAAKPVAEPVEDEGGDDGADDQEDDQDGTEGDENDDDGADDQEENPKPKKTAKEHQIERLKREKADLARQLREAEQRGIENLAAKLEALEKRLPGGNTGDNQDAGTPAPDPSDFEKYPLGHLDPDYIEDRIEYVAEQKAKERADAALQRQQEVDQTQEYPQPLLEKVDQLTVQGSELYEDFQEVVVDAGMRGDWDLQQPTFEAAAEVEHGVQILYELSQDKKEASRVAKLSMYQQMKYVEERNAEIGKSKTPRRKPQAGEPPKNIARGANSRTQINPATDNLDDFEKLYEADARKSR